VNRVNTNKKGPRMENYEWKKSSEKLEETTRQFEHFLIDIKLAHLKMKIEILKNNYSFQKKENEYKKKLKSLKKNYLIKIVKHIL
jgi:uncharacterized radical SAM superfamily protein